MIIFGVPNAHTNDAYRAAECALTIRDIITTLHPPTVDGAPVNVYCQIGIAKGGVFAAEIGEPRGRREFNVLGDAVNTAARLMGKSQRNQILMTPAVFEEVGSLLRTEPVGEISLKGKSAPIMLYALNGFPTE